MSRPLAAAAVCFALLSAAPLLAGDSLVADGAEVKKLAGGFVFTEGPAADKDGNVYFTDIPNERIHRYGADGKLSTFLEKSGRANGLFFDKDGNLFACQGGARKVVFISPKSKTVKVAADEFDGKKLNSPNDLWIDPEGGVYFTDPRYGGQDDLQQGGFHVYYILPGFKGVRRVIDDLKKPNGVIGTRDGKLLYVADPGDNKTYVYKIERPGKLGERKLFAEQGSDGMTLDERGNLYLTAREGLNVYTAKGDRIESIKVPESPANVTFGGKENKTLFITARTSLYAVPMKVQGQ